MNTLVTCQRDTKAGDEIKVANQLTRVIIPSCLGRPSGITSLLKSGRGRQKSQRSMWKSTEERSERNNVSGFEAGRRP